LFVFECRRELFLGVAANVLLTVSANGAPNSNPNDDEIAKYQLVYEAPEECPNKKTLLEQINHRTERNWQALPDQTGGMFTIAVHKTNGTYHARMAIADRSGHAAFRDNFEGTNCDDVLVDLAIAAVAAIDSRLGPQPPYVEFGAVVGPDWRTGVLALGGGGLAGIRWPSSGRSFELSVGYWDTGTSEANRVSNVEIRLKLYAARLDFCLFEPKLSKTVSVPLCAGITGGFLQAQHVETADGSSSPMTGWASLGLAPQLRWSGDTLFVQVGPKADVLFYPNHLKDRIIPSGQPSETMTLHRFPAVGFAMNLTVGFRLP
jgi:hypothetical protein